MWYEGTGVVLAPAGTETVPELAGEDARATWCSVTGDGGSEGGSFEAPGFGHAEVLGDTRTYSCVMWSRILELLGVV